MRGFVEYVASCAVAVALLGAITWALTAPADHRMILLSGALCIGVQVVAFLVARALQRKNLMLGWGLGSVLRLVVLVLYAVVVARLWRGALTPALLSFVAFVFVTTVFEPVFLRR